MPKGGGSGVLAACLVLAACSSPEQAPMRASVPVYPVRGDYFEIRGFFFTSAYVDVGPRHPQPRPEGASSLGAAPDRDVFVVAERPLSLTTITLVGGGACEVRVVRQLEVSIGVRYDEQPADPSEDVRTTLLEVERCAGLAAPRMGVGGGAPVTWRALGAPAPVSSDVGTPCAAVVGHDLDEGSTMRALSVPGSFVVLGSDVLVVTPAGARAIRGDVDGEIVVGDRSYLLMHQGSAPELWSLDGSDPEDPAPTYLVPASS